jgi:hypothetical protein
MTDHEMRIRLAEAMGWTDLYDSAYGMLWGTEPATDIGYDAPRRVGIEVPNPLESDRDAARLRAWCARRGWRITCCHDEGAAWWRVSDLRCQGPRAESMVDAASAWPCAGPCCRSSRLEVRRERLDDGGRLPAHLRRRPPLP